MMNIQEKRKAVMNITNSIKSELGFSTAQRQAWKAFKTRQAMKNNIVTIAYKKANGEYRTAICTLCPALLPVSKSNGTKRAKPAHQVCYFDIEKGMFRSFHAARLVSVIKVESLLSIVTNSFTKTAFAA